LSRVGRFAARALSPFVAPAGTGRTLIAWAYNSEESGQNKAIEGVWYQW
jgi:hypothetical protein